MMAVKGSSMGIYLYYPQKNTEEASSARIEGG